MIWNKNRSSEKWKRFVNISNQEKKTCSFQSMILQNTNFGGRFLLVYSLTKINVNQSRMCGKGVGLGLFPSEVEKWSFFDHFWANFGYVSHIPAIRF